MSIPAFTTLGAGATVLMLHGIGGGHLAFAPQVETLASQGYRAVAWDMPGYGHSAPIEPYTFMGLAQSCIRLIESLQCGTVVLVGHSMGGMVAQEVVARRPELVNRLVLCGTSPSFG
jgi:pimeloyl-ACP methyl ester carboxylesterase